MYMLNIYACQAPAAAQAATIPAPALLRSTATTPAYSYWPHRRRQRSSAASPFTSPTACSLRSSVLGSVTPGRNNALQHDSQLGGALPAAGSGPRDIASFIA